jgi:hypothetical protein
LFMVLAGAVFSSVLRLASLWVSCVMTVSKDFELHRRASWLRVESRGRVACVDRIGSTNPKMMRHVLWGSWKVCFT